MGSYYTIFLFFYFFLGEDVEWGPWGGVGSVTVEVSSFFHSLFVTMRVLTPYRAWYASDLISLYIHINYNLLMYER